MALFNQIFGWLNSRRKSERFRSFIDVELQTEPAISAKIIDMSFGGLKVQLQTSDMSVLQKEMLGTDISMRLYIPPQLDRLILYESPLDVTVTVVRVDTSICQLGAKWGDINPVVLSTLIQSLAVVRKHT